MTVPEIDGLQIVVDAEGQGRETERGDTVDVHYTGFLGVGEGNTEKGKQFDSSIPRKRPLKFTVGTGQVIKGWDEGLLGMKKGEKRTLYISPFLGYGNKDVGEGLIPPNSTLIFETELVGIEGE
ncbi:peptidyl-prolyl cis-trans isomerase fkr-2 [Lasiosphaeria miniovina]|uniref:peptidylprolyl isomerase n=2 Tax=Lasiosphaeria TaxID=92901 RepID=A0AA40E726_9PEZI|nr:peptidyl-prolyl cis-trans isomerase fkr-2 [Lasiosphaeria miniovina]KAK0727432.1 peptidyl-prolyl cis-trans isomerase fkr-2 [Lasiosphaeria miniovina]KAK3366086.1 peptidyl-prolyl cis-trans isomerase fkr-2 [Lasiosphaeria ovina]